MLTTQSCHEMVQSLFDELGIDPAAPISESILLRDGFLVGRRYQREGIRIVWFFEAAELKVWGSDGKLLKVFVLPEQHRQAA
ncbi:MAG: hypothetical protein K8T91_15535 [Planctomycetes bacterium]|nr:hypothetical protein [Planctomycetota bacterium]